MLWQQKRIIWHPKERVMLAEYAKFCTEEKLIID